MINSELEFKLEEVLPKFSVNLQEKIQHSVELLRKSERLALAYDCEDGFYLAFSGGKDSQCLYQDCALAALWKEASADGTAYKIMSWLSGEG